jgi:hypothetical protein
MIIHAMNQPHMHSLAVAMPCLAPFVCITCKQATKQFTYLTMGHMHPSSMIVVCIALMYHLCPWFYLCCTTWRLQSSNHHHKACLYLCSNIPLLHIGRGIVCALHPSCSWVLAVALLSHELLHFSLQVQKQFQPCTQDWCWQLGTSCCPGCYHLSTHCQPWWLLWCWSHGC